MRFLSRGRVRDIAVLTALLLAVLVLAPLAYRVQRVSAHPIDDLAVMLPTTGLHELEPLVDRPGFFRWTNGNAQLEPPNPGGPLLLRIRLSSGLDTATPLTLRVGDLAHAFFAVPGLHSYALPLPPQPGERVAIHLDSQTVTIDGRDLGVVVQSVAVAGGGQVPLAVIGSLVLAVLGSYSVLRQSGVGSTLAGLLVLALLLLALCWLAVGGWRYGLIGLLGVLGVGALAAVLFERRFPPLPATALPARQFAPRDAWALGAVLIVAVLCWLPWLWLPDPVGDMELAARRMGRMFEQGLAAAHTGGGDYMPLRIYLLRGLSFLVQPLGGAFYDPVPPITNVLIKLPSLLALLVTTVLLFAWSRRWRDTGGAALIAGLYAVSPPVWMNAAWWGQVDVLLSLPMLVAIVLLDQARGRWSWFCWGLGLLIKPQAIILAPLMGMATLRRYGCRGLAEGGAMLATMLIVAATPIVLAGQGPGLYQAAAGSVGRFPVVTNRAYNLWYLVAQDRPVSDIANCFGGLSYRNIGLLLVGSVAVLVMLALWRRPDALMRAAGAAVLALAFFVLPTQIHERYAFFALPFLLLSAAANSRMLLPFAVLCVTATINNLGAIGGFWPDAQEWIRATPLPLIVAWINILVLLGLITHMLWMAMRDDEMRKQETGDRRWETGDGRRGDRMTGRQGDRVTG
jgi:Gpi18-like mannosyltransferase